jgi:hypothetical protein
MPRGNKRLSDAAGQVPGESRRHLRSRCTLVEKLRDGGHQLRGSERLGCLRFLTLVEALNRHRGKGQQKVTVEHVHVHAGGQAVVGVVEPPGGRGEANSKDQPHAKALTDEPQQALRCADEEGEALPIAGDAKRTLPNARRPVSGRTKGQ